MNPIVEPSLRINSSNLPNFFEFLLPPHIDKQRNILYYRTVAKTMRRFQGNLKRRRGGIGRRTGLKILRDKNPIPVRPRSPAL